MPKAAKATKYGMKRKNGKKKSGNSNKRSAAGYGTKGGDSVYTENNRKNPKSVNYSYPTDGTYGDY